MLSDERESCVVLQHVWHVVNHAFICQNCLRGSIHSFTRDFFGLDLLPHCFKPLQYKHLIFIKVIFFVVVAHMTSKTKARALIYFIFNKVRVSLER